MVLMIWVILQAIKHSALTLEAYTCVFKFPLILCNSRQYQGLFISNLTKPDHLETLNNNNNV